MQIRVVGKSEYLILLLSQIGLRLQLKLNNVFILCGRPKDNTVRLNTLLWEATVRSIWCCRRVRKIAKSDYLLRHIYLSVRVCPHGTIRLPLDEFS